MAPVLAVVLGLLALGASLADVPLAIARHQTGPGGPVVYTLITLAVAVPGTAMGVSLAARRPRNPIGWLLLALLLLAANPASDYAILDYRLHHGTLPLGWAAVLFLASSPAVPVLLAILLWVFPDGRLPGRWRPVAWALIAAGVLLVVVTTVAPGVTAVAGHHVRIDTGGNLYPVSPAWTMAGNVATIAAIVSMLAWLAVQVITAVLAGVFAGLVILATEVLPFKTPVAVAAATLAAAALFNPLRRRVQHAVDRRFNRARYDAATVVAAFTARLHHSADFDTVHGDLVSAIHQAFQPAHISLWSAPGPALRRRAPAGEGGHRDRIGAEIEEML
jgi:hypothetical protein